MGIAPRRHLWQSRRSRRVRVRCLDTRPGLTVRPGGATTGQLLVAPDSSRRSASSALRRRRCCSGAGRDCKACAGRAAARRQVRGRARGRARSVPLSPPPHPAAFIRLRDSRSAVALLALTSRDQIIQRCPTRQGPACTADWIGGYPATAFVRPLAGNAAQRPLLLRPPPLSSHGRGPDCPAGRRDQLRHPAGRLAQPPTGGVARQPARSPQGARRQGGGGRGWRT